MNKKTLLITLAALFILNALNINIGRVSAPPLSPYLAVVPSNSYVMVGMSFTVSIYTDYGGSNVWGWDVILTFNPALLQCVNVVNGDLITTIKDPSAEWKTPTINNVAGVVTAGADFYYDPPGPPPVRTSGPGTLAILTFKGLSTGYSALTLEKGTWLLVYDPSEDPVKPVVEIAPDKTPYQIGHGTAMVTVTGDITGPENPPGSAKFPPDGKVDTYDLAYLGKKFGTNDPVADFTGPENPPGSGIYPPDGTVNTYDLAALGKNFGKHI